MQATSSPGAGVAEIGGATFLDLPIVLVAAAWFFNLPAYMGMFVIEWLTPLLFALGTLLLLLVRQLATGDYRRPIDPSLPTWILGLTLLDFVWFAMFGGGDTGIIGPRIVYLSFMLALYLAFAAAPDLRRRVLKAIYIGSWIVVPVLFYDITHPFVFVPAQSEFAHLGRAAGLYINPNQAAAALCAALFLCWWSLPRGWRWLYVAWIAIGVFLTASRAALVLLPFVFLVMALLGRVSAGELLKLLLVLLFLGICGFLALPFVADYIGIKPEYVSSRFLAVLNLEQSMDVSGDERSQLAAKGFAKFLDSPFLGNGVGSTELWVERASTHNMFLQLLSDFGVIGIAVLPLLLLMAVLRGRPGRASNALVSVTVFYVLWGAFSHNLVTEAYLMLAVVLAFSSGSATDARGDEGPLEALRYGGHGAGIRDDIV